MAEIQTKRRGEAGLKRKGLEAPRKASRRMKRSAEDGESNRGLKSRELRRGEESRGGSKKRKESRRDGVRRE